MERRKPESLSWEALWILKCGAAPRFYIQMPPTRRITNLRWQPHANSPSLPNCSTIEGFSWALPDL